MQKSRIEQLLEFIKDEPQDVFSHYAIAHEYFVQENYTLSEQFYLKVLDLDPNYIGVFYQLAELYKQIKDYGKAFEVLDQGIELAKNLNKSNALRELKSSRQQLEDDLLDD